MHGVEPFHLSGKLFLCFFPQANMHSKKIQSLCRPIAIQSKQRLIRFATLWIEYYFNGYGTELEREGDLYLYLLLIVIPRYFFMI